MGCCEPQKGKEKTQAVPDSPDAIRGLVRENYGRIAQAGLGCCGGAEVDTAAVGKKIGYSQEELAVIPEGANLGLGCGNPTAIDTLQPGETVLDLGSGAGMDAFLAADKVGAGGRVIGVDMTEEMVSRAKRNAEKIGKTNVEFLHGTIEALPLEDATVDVVISNCVINLSPEKERVFAEAFRVLRPGGRLMVSDIVLTAELPAAIKTQVESYVGCVAGASLKEEYLAATRKAGFEKVEVVRETSFADSIGSGDEWMAAAAQVGLSREQVIEAASSVRSVHLYARKPAD